MARWRLVASHYLNVPGSEWEYKEVDRSTGRQKRTTFPVPQHLNPDEPSDWNYVYGKDSGEIIVAHAGKNEPKDIIFTGAPTPDMVPLDDEAKEISARFASVWKHPIESLSGSYAEELLKDMGKEMDDLRGSQNKPAAIEGMTELLTAMTTMMKQNQELISALALRVVEDPKASTPTPRRA